MSDQTEVKGISDEERDVNKAQYVGKRLYRLFVDVQNEIHSARKHKVSDDVLGAFATLDCKALIAAARELGQVPEWGKESAPVGKKLTYELFKGAGPVAQ